MKKPTKKGCLRKIGDTYYLNGVEVVLYMDFSTAAQTYYFQYGGVKYYTNDPTLRRDDILPYYETPLTLSVKRFAEAQKRREKPQKGKRNKGRKSDFNPFMQGFKLKDPENPL